MSALEAQLALETLEANTRLLARAVAGTGVAAELCELIRRDIARVRGLVVVTIPPTPSERERGVK